jgi:hypothetical protein
LNFGLVLIIFIQVMHLDMSIKSIYGVLIHS